MLSFWWNTGYFLRQKLSFWRQWRKYRQYGNNCCFNSLLFSFHRCPAYVSGVRHRGITDPGRGHMPHYHLYPSGSWHQGCSAYPLECGRQGPHWWAVHTNYWPFVRGIQRHVDSLHKGPVMVVGVVGQIILIIWYIWYSNDDMWLALRSSESLMRANDDILYSLAF